MFVETLVATFSQGWRADTKFPKANCCLGWGSISFIHPCNVSTWVVSVSVWPKHHVICLVLILASSNSLMWRMCSEGKSVYNALIDQFHFCSHLPVLLALFLRKNNYMESGFSWGLFWFMSGTDKDLPHQESKIRWGKKCSFHSTNKSSVSTVQEYTALSHVWALRISRHVNGGKSLRSFRYVTWTWDVS